ncbi:hypothetical protein ADUPG1_005204, partial [Aduncisulcus paluster]
MARTKTRKTRAAVATEACIQAFTSLQEKKPKDFWAALHTVLPGTKDGEIPPSRESVIALIGLMIDDAHFKHIVACKTPRKPLLARLLCMVSSMDEPAAGDFVMAFFDWA